MKKRMELRTFIEKAKVWDVNDSAYCFILEGCKVCPMFQFGYIDLKVACSSDQCSAKVQELIRTQEVLEKWKQV